jgi:cytidylate kinase
MVAENLGLRIINYTFKDMAKERGISFEEMVELANRHPPRYDIELDQKLVAMASEPGCVLGSRLAIWLLKDADLKVYLAGSPEVRARRIADREGIDYRVSLESMMKRDKLDHARYREIYHIDTDRYEFADLVIDTETMDPQAESDAIVGALTAKMA